MSPVYISCTQNQSQYPAEYEESRAVMNFKFGMTSLSTVVLIDVRLTLFSLPMSAKFLKPSAMNMQSLRMFLQKLSNLRRMFFHAKTLFAVTFFSAVKLSGLLKSYLPYPVFQYIVRMNCAMLETPASTMMSSGI